MFLSISIYLLLKMLVKKYSVLLLFATSILLPLGMVESSFSQNQTQDNQSTTLQNNVTAETASTTTTTAAPTSIPENTTSNTTMMEKDQTATQNATQSIPINDSETFLLAGHSLPEQGYIHLYDSTPNTILSAHIAAKIPCNDNNSTDMVILIGPSTDVQTSGLNHVPLLSEPGELCLYKGDLSAAATNVVTDIAIFNNSTDDIVFPPTTSIILNINEVAPLPS